jgi:hypothetical protein
MVSRLNAVSMLLYRMPCVQIDNTLSLMNLE